MTTDNTSFSLDAAPACVKPVHVLPYRHEEPLFWISSYFAATVWLCLLLVTLGFIIPIMLLVSLFGLFLRSLLISWLKGNSVKVTAEQFPDLHLLYQETCAKLGINAQPQLYLAQSDGMLNAMATRFMRRDYVVLLSTVVEALADRPQAIKFYMGHELGHIHRKHLSRHWWLWPGMLIPLFAPAYSRARIYTCDRYGFASCDNLEDAKHALAVLVAGPKRWEHINLRAFESQAQETGHFWMAVNELTADYPWLCKRMMALENRNAVFPKRNFFAWMIAMVSPRMGYGGAVFGLLYWLIIGGLILTLTLVLTFSGVTDPTVDSDSKPKASTSWFEKNPIKKLFKQWSKTAEDEDEDDRVGEKHEEFDEDDVAIARTYGYLLNVVTDIDNYVEKNQQKAPKTLAALGNEEYSQAVGYAILYDKKKSPDQILELKMSIHKCENCDGSNPHFRFNKIDGDWYCHVVGISQEQLQKQDFGCKQLN